MKQNNKKKNKGEYGYLRAGRKKKGILTVVGAALIAGLYLTGYLIFDGKANILTLFAVLAALPSAKAFVGLYILIPHKSLTESELDAVRKVSDRHILYDVILSSAEAIYFLPAVYFRDKTVYFYANGKKIDLKKLEAYVRSIMTAKHEGEVHAEVDTVKGFAELDPFLNLVQRKENAAGPSDCETDNEADIRHVFSVYSV